MKKISIFIVFLLAFQLVHAQERRLVQFSGIVLDESNKPLPFTSIQNLFKKNSRYTGSNFNGYFSFVVAEGDSILFSTIGYSPQVVVIPNNISNQSFVQTVKMRGDTIQLPEVKIFPFPTREEFKQVFLSLKVPDDDLTRANANVNPILLAYLAYNQGLGAEGNANAYFARINTANYTRGQTQAIPFMDVMKVAEFFRLLKEGRITLKNDPPKN